MILLAGCKNVELPMMNVEHFVLRTTGATEFESHMRARLLEGVGNVENTRRNVDY